MPSSYDVVISGASAAGLSLARALKQASGGDLEIALIDRTAPRAAGDDNPRAYAISAASRHVLEQLGVWERCVCESQAVSRIEITDSALGDGVRPVVLAYDNILADGEPATHIVPEVAIVSSLQAAIAQDMTIDKFWHDEIAALEPAGGRVRITTQAGHRFGTRLLVCAEGRQSALRARVGIKMVGWSYDQTGIVVRVAHERPHQATALQHFLPAGPFAVLPLPGHRSCITWSEEAQSAQRILALDDAAFLSEVEMRVGGRLGGIELDSTRQSWPLALSLARSYIAPRFALIGDSAHGVHPLAGQGLNLALRDVAALAEVIVDAARVGLDIGGAMALERYQRWRRFDSAVSAAAFDALNRLFSNDNVVLRAFRDAGVGVIDRLPHVKDMFVREAAGLSGDVPRLMRGEAI